jgi:hypothetical protein
MDKYVASGALATALLLGAVDVRAEEKEPSAILEIGAAREWSFSGGTSFGPSVAVEFTPIKEVLEIEFGVASLYGHGRTEWGMDLLFKKPFPISDTFEFMIGAGPEVTYTTGGEGTKLSAEFALDFMFWPSKERKFGWFIEPTYSYSLSKGHEQSFTVSVGLLFGIP